MGVFMRYVPLVLIVLSGMLFPSCSQSPKVKDHRGYMTRSYTVRGVRYHPMSVEQALCFSQTGMASHYDESGLWGMWSGETSMGEDVSPWHLHAAHKTLPLPSEVRVTSLANGKSVKVRINDRGPFVKGRIIDLSSKAADKLGMKGHGVVPVRIEVLSVGDGPWKKTSSRFR